MSTIRIEVPTTFDAPSTYDKLFRLCSHAADSREKTVALDFSGCTFSHQHGVALVGALVRHVQRQGRQVTTHVESTAVRSNLRKNGFLEFFKLDAQSLGINTIPFREDKHEDSASFLTYLRDDWLGRGWVEVSPRLDDSIANAILESYTNAFEHGGPSGGVFSCGQFYPNKREIALTIVNLRLGIPGTVRTVKSAAHLGDPAAIAWSLVKGHTSKPGKRGVGLEILESFVALNGGRMDILSHKGHVRIDQDGRELLTRASCLTGTMINLVFKADETRYAFRNELTEEDIF